MMRKGLERKRKLAREDDKSGSRLSAVRAIRAIRLVLQQPPSLALPKLCFHHSR